MVILRKIIVSSVIAKSSETWLSMILVPQIRMSWAIPGGGRQGDGVGVGCTEVLVKGLVFV